MTSIRKSLFIVAAFAVIAFAQNVAQADPLVLSLQNNSFSIAPGGSVTLVASAFNSGATNTNTDRILGANVAVVGGWGHDFSPFGTNFHTQSVTNGNTLGPLAAITLTDFGNGPGSYSGSLSFQYESIPAGAGPLGGTSLVTNVVQFTIRITGADSVPEPTTMLLLGTGVAGIAAKLKRRKKQLDQ